jgi:Utp14 protein
MISSYARLCTHNAGDCMLCTQVAARQAELQRMRALLFYHERKRHHINKIKSKMYHKVTRVLRATLRLRQDCMTLDSVIMLCLPMVPR